MGHEDRRSDHEATDGLLNLLKKGSHDLNAVQFKLEREFQQVYPDNVTPSLIILSCFLLLPVVSLFLNLN
uniref:Ska2 N-terminal domain-containing protein n=1 Tax=Rhizophora mucronata TaxID=61149 RepID=A0A2P2KAT3_RHIMU